MHPEPIDVTPPASSPEEAAAPKSKRTRNIVLGSLLAVAVAGGAVAGIAGWRILQQKDAKLMTPDEVAGLRLDRSERAASTADYLRTAIGAQIDLDESMGAVYADPAAADRSVLIFGGTTLLLSPERDLDSLFELLSDDTGKVNGVKAVEAGDLGGVMKCGTSASPEGDMPVCGWADHGSVAIAMFPGRSVDDSATLLRDIRDGILKR
ncbi:hypothetical protein [Micromonospora sp. CPCC 206061]|uniref:hypothetical protein n=1 Tax=Micromonospora sp. CPCC 206061 TaxID=3122410 RepID=UPI002FF21FBB